MLWHKASAWAVIMAGVGGSLGGQLLVVTKLVRVVTGTGREDTGAL